MNPERRFAILSFHFVNNIHFPSCKQEQIQGSAASWSGVFCLRTYPHRDPEKTRREVERMINRCLPGIRDKPVFPDETADPAILI
jgi:hypothetical protein